MGTHGNTRSVSRFQRHLAPGSADAGPGAASAGSTTEPKATQDIPVGATTIKAETQQAGTAAPGAAQGAPANETANPTTAGTSIPEAKESERPIEEEAEEQAFDGAPPEEEKPKKPERPPPKAARPDTSYALSGGQLPAREEARGRPPALRPAASTRRLSRPHRDTGLTREERDQQNFEGQLITLRQRILHNLEYCHVQSLPPSLFGLAPYAGSPTVPEQGGSSHLPAHSLAARDCCVVEVRRAANHRLVLRGECLCARA